MDAKYTNKAQVGDVIIIDEKKALEYIVIRAELEGGGTGHGFHDIYSDGWHVNARKLNPDGSYDPKAETIDFYQSGSFTNMKEKVKLVGKMEQAFVSVFDTTINGEKMNTQQAKNEDITQQNIYAVKTEGDCEGKTISTLGYATGDVDDIKKYFDDRKMYHLRLTELNVVHITPESFSERIQLKSEKADLEQRLKQIKNQLRTNKL